MGYNSGVDSSGHTTRSQKDLPDELTCRRTSFRPGTPIRLADGQMWTLPAPPHKSEWKAVPFAAEYTGIVQAILESEDISERRLGELAFTIFLLGHNYCLTPTDYERLLGSSAPSFDTKARRPTSSGSHKSIFIRIWMRPGYRSPSSRRRVPAAGRLDCSCGSANTCRQAGPHSNLVVSTTSKCPEVRLRQRKIRGIRACRL